jgi:hypothetical protein
MAKPAAATKKTAVVAAAAMVLLILIVKSYSPGEFLKTDEIRAGSENSPKPEIGMRTDRAPFAVRTELEIRFAAWRE